MYLFGHAQDRYKWQKLNCAFVSQEAGKERKHSWCEQLLKLSQVMKMAYGASLGQQEFSLIAWRQQELSLMLPGTQRVKSHVAVRWQQMSGHLFLHCWFVSCARLKQNAGVRLCTCFVYDSIHSLIFHQSMVCGGDLVYVVSKCWLSVQKKQKHNYQSILRHSLPRILCETQLCGQNKLSVGWRDIPCHKDTSWHSKLYSYAFSPYKGMCMCSKSSSQRKMRHIVGHIAGPWTSMLYSRTVMVS